MTTNITIHPAGHHVQVRTYDRIYDSESGTFGPFKLADERILAPGAQPLTLYATTTREISVIDLDPADVPQVPDPRTT